MHTSKCKTKTKIDKKNHAIKMSAVVRPLLLTNWLPFIESNYMYIIINVMYFQYLIIKVRPTMLHNQTRIMNCAKTNKDNTKRHGNFTRGMH